MDKEKPIIELSEDEMEDLNDELCKLGYDIEFGIIDSEPFYRTIDIVGWSARCREKIDKDSTVRECLTLADQLSKLQ